MRRLRCTAVLVFAALCPVACGSESAEGGATPDGGQNPGGSGGEPGPVGGSGGEPGPEGGSQVDAAIGGAPSADAGSTGGAGGSGGTGGSGGSGGIGGSGGSGGSGGNETPDAAVGDCILPAVVDTEIVIGSACPPIATAGVSIVAGGRLQLDPGVVLRFADGALLTISGGGTLDARGAADNAVVLEGQTAAAGSWQGLYVTHTGEVTATVNLDHALVRHGGFSGPDALGGVTINSSQSAHAVSVTSTTFSDCGTYGVLVPGPRQDFAAFTDVSFERTETALSLHADVVGSVPPGVGLEPGTRLQLRGGTVERSQTWFPQSVPWQVDVAIAVGGAASPELTLAPGLSLVMSPGVDVLVGATPGGLRATDVQFGPRGADGPWGGIGLLPGTTVAALEGVQVTGTGGPGSPGIPVAAGVFVQGDGAAVEITDSVFADNVVDILLDCGGSATLSGNTATVETGDGC